MKMKLTQTVEIITPKVPNYLKLSNGEWAPLIALARKDLKAVADEYHKALEKRWDEQMSNPQAFHYAAGKMKDA